jgi:hypothetical protein
MVSVGRYGRRAGTPDEQGTSDEKNKPDHGDPQLERRLYEPSEPTMAQEKQIAHGEIIFVRMR